MSTLDYEKQHHRLRVAGVCSDSDASTVCAAVQRLAHAGASLIVDLTAVSAMTPEVARSLVAAQAASHGCRVSLLRKSGSVVDSRLLTAEFQTRDGPDRREDVRTPSKHLQNSSNPTGIRRRES